MPKKQRPKTLSLTKKSSSLEFSISCQTGSPWVVGDVPSTHLRHEPQLSIHLRFKLGHSCREILQLGVQRSYEPQLI